ncbi:glycosyltransferase family 4 protein [Pseudomonas sp. AN-1]|uniref:glycosyltransferase family 4 protein n=1 Tax=Pseudomonas sp. AN-1 TaxID=3096605 RepID=UPI002A6B6078|nr:glycosyltransferase family 4 protein [Pseudomonas sp. AN-1]WPP47396.1 glycosyltransferase family 4 protein [Pseudomonas sp. AN-1]
MTKVFVVSEYVYSAQNSTGYFWSKVIDKAGQHFRGISVVTPTSSEQDCTKSKVPGVSYLEFDAIKFNKNKLASRLIGQSRQCVGFLRHMLRHVRRGDIVLSGTNPALLLFLIPIMKKFTGFRWCLLVHDVFPENLVPAGILRKSSPSYRLFSRLFNLIYSRADHLIVIGRDMKELMSKKTGSDTNITVIQNWVSDHDVYPESRADSEILNRLDWRDRIIFQFFGNIGRVQGIDNILAAIKLVKSPKAAFLFIGDGSSAKTVKEFIENHPGDNIAYIGPLDQSQKKLGLAACDVALITLEKGMLGLGVPSKAYFSMAADKPLLAVMEDTAEIARMIHEEAIGWSCAPDDPAALAALIDNICQAHISSMHGHPRKVLQEKYSESAALDKFIACMNSVIEAKK